ncbi:zinc ribbon domain-containing protein [Methanocella conradii]|uniref:zinc ribbon domain-containing protein n=1 Tax=Methanocella conradii TaxID=1175444 RepID=UPI0024B34020|nr:zinc ribbon domain-containing protein [Methanocella conradii]MDI6897918.1 zinc ribbon domain-containing protein [Methanocella conradii]
MSELLAKVEMMAQYVELYEDEVRVQMPLAPMRVIKLRDIFGIDFKKANFFIAGKMTIKYRERGVPQSAYYPFNFTFNDEMENLVRLMNEMIAKMSEDGMEGAIVKEVIKVRCRYCGGLMDEKAEFCPVCGRPQR